MPQERPDEHIPTEYEGRLEPNARCRAWLPHTNAYCDRDAGEGTDHPGEGRCEEHQGRPPTVATSGRYRRLPEKLQEIYEEHAAVAQGDPLDVTGDLALLRAVLEDVLAESAGDEEAPLPIGRVSKLVDQIAKIAARQQQLRMKNAISREELSRLMFVMGQSVKRHVTNEELDAEGTIRAIDRDWANLDIP